jgi:hypothetical protein
VVEGDTAIQSQSDGMSLKYLYILHRNVLEAFWTALQFSFDGSLSSMSDYNTYGVGAFAHPDKLLTHYGSTVCLLKMVLTTTTN